MQYSKHSKNILLLVTILLSLITYYFMGYSLERSAFSFILLSYLILFICSYMLIHFNKHNYILLASLAVLFRLILLVAIPELSQDFYRFIWDGRLLLKGFNVYISTPNSFITSGQIPIAQAQLLIDGMGALSAGNHTNYPPLNQLCFMLAGMGAGNSILGSVMIMRILIILADIGTLYIGTKLLIKFHLPVHRIFFYMLNPLIIIELTGNLHFESLMVFFLVLSIYFLQIDRWKLSAFVFSLAISVKLIPLLFIPLLCKKLGAQKWVMYSSIVALVTTLSFMPFLSVDFLQHYTQTVGLWFQKFEFNASVYYLIRELSYGFRGYNEIALIGPALAIVVLVFTLTAGKLNGNKHFLGLLGNMIMVLSVYFLCATTVHPWYIATPLFLSIFLSYRFIAVWSFAVVLSYSAYTSTGFYENGWFIALEYVLVYGTLFYEIYHKKKSYFSLVHRVK